MTRPRALSCPLCGGTVAPPNASRKIDCAYCGRPLIYAGEDFMSTLVLAPILGEAEHQAVCLKLFHHPLVPGDLARSATLIRKRRSYIPFYLLTGKRGGVLAVGKERSVTKLPGVGLSSSYSVSYFSDGELAGQKAFQSKTEVEVLEDSRVIVGDFRYVYAAAALENWDFADTALKEVVAAHLGEARPVTIGELARDGDVVDADLPLDRIVERGVTAGLGTKGELKVLEMEARVVYVPVLTLSFRYGRQSFSVTLEELGGTWLAGQMPFRKDWAYLSSVPLAAVLGLVAGNLLGFVAKIHPAEWSASPGLAKVVAVLGLGVGLGMLVGLQAAWLLLRTPFVVRVLAGGQRVERAGEPPKNPFSPANALLKFLIEAAAKGRPQSGWDA